MAPKQPFHFSSWFPLTERGVRQSAPARPAAVQVRVEDGLIDYSGGRSSAMVFYFYASEDAQESLRRLFADEIAEPGARGRGALLFRYIPGEDDVLEHLKRLLFRFHAQFNSLPLFNQQSAERSDQVF